MGTTKKDEEYIYTPFEYGAFSQSEETNAAKDSLNKANDALTNLGDFNWINQGKLDDYTSQYENRDKFSYDFNTDALYQQYKDKYIKQAKMASADVMGQAAAMNGGYGSSYAQTVGNQAYQASLGQLNDVIPQLYQLAYEKYNQEGQDLLNTISLLRGEREFAYGQHNDKYTKLADDRTYWGNMYNSLYNRDYTTYSSDRTFAQTNHNNEETAKYNTYRDSVADQQWQDNFDLAKQQYEDSKYANAGGTYKVSKDENGNPVVTPDVDAVSKVDTNISLSDMMSNVLSYVDKGKQADYLAEFVNAGRITTDQAEKILNGENIISLSDREWKDTYNGGINWFGGVDNNAIVKDQYGNKFTLKELKTALEKEGMSSKEAKQYIKKLQDQLDI